ncbi:hypothetical protein BLJ79_14935 [Arthrobacter sp. UCD-GKA]|nr:hypothetical protein BLJ79_14935 [Arthrobacter sp. UCD-GKA]
MQMEHTVSGGADILGLEVQNDQLLYGAIKLDVVQGDVVWRREVRGEAMRSAFKVAMAPILAFEVPVVCRVPDGGGFDV